MFQPYRRLFAFLFLAFFVQIFYSIIDFQIRKQYKSYGTLIKTLDKSFKTSISLSSQWNTKDLSLNFRNTINVGQLSNHTIVGLHSERPQNINIRAVKSNINRIETLINASFIETLEFSIPNEKRYTNLPECKISFINNNFNDSSIYKVSVNSNISSYAEIESRHGTRIYFGGHSYPSHCHAKQRLAIIVCYRQREQHLKIFLNHIHPFLKKQKLDYTIVIVNQHGNELFNRGALFNIGYIESIKLYPFTCFIFHDVDLLPEDLRNIYKCDKFPRHMSVAVDKFNYKLLYPTLFGGVTAIDIDDFIRTNGYPNVYWGWGNEDDDMYLRVTKKLKKNITRYPIEIARYKMIRTHGHKSGTPNPYRDVILNSKYDYNLDGLNTVRYHLHHVRLYRMFVLVNVSLIEESYEQIRTRLKMTTKVPRKKIIPTI